MKTDAACFALVLLARRRPASSIDLLDATYGRDALVRTTTPTAASGRFAGIDVRYRATSAVWDPIAGHIPLDEVAVS